jgi:simple sugar transport system permease protein
VIALGKLLPRVDIEKRREPLTPRDNLTLVVASIVVGILIGGVLFGLAGVSPIFAYWKILQGSFGSLQGWMEILRKAIPLMMAGAGLAIAFRAVFWNIGAEGQMLAGAVGATWVALNFPESPAWILIPAMFGIGFVFGAGYCLIPAILKSKFNVNEVIITLMLNYIALQIVTYLIDGPWKGATQHGYPYTDPFVAAARIPRIPGTSIHYPTLIMAVVASVCLYYLMKRSRAGYEIKVTGHSPKAARYAGISYVRTLILVALISGGLAGLAGVGEVSGIHGKLLYPHYVSAGYGFTAIIVAWLARLHPAGVIVSSIFMSGILVGGDAMRLRVPLASVNIFTGLILMMLVSTEILRTYSVRFSWGRPT